MDTTVAGNTCAPLNVIDLVQRRRSVKTFDAFDLGILSEHPCYSSELSVFQTSCVGGTLPFELGKAQGSSGLLRKSSILMVLPTRSKANAVSTHFHRTLSKRSPTKNEHFLCRNVV